MKHWIVTVALVGLASGSVAADPDTKGRRPKRIDAETSLRLRKLEAAAQPIEPVAPVLDPAPSQVELDTLARIDAVTDERVYYSLPVTSAQAALLVGVREVATAAEVVDGTIFEGRYRISCLAGSPARASELLTQVGKDVIITFRRNEQLVAVATRWRMP